MRDARDLVAINQQTQIWHDQGTLVVKIFKPLRFDSIQKANRQYTSSGDQSLQFVESFISKHIKYG